MEMLSCELHIYCARSHHWDSLPDLPRGEHVWLAVVLVAPAIAACPADRLRALRAVVIGLAVQADRASRAPGPRPRAPVRLAGATHPRQAGALKSQRSAR